MKRKKLQEERMGQKEELTKNNKLNSRRQTKSMAREKKPASGAAKKLGADTISMVNIAAKDETLRIAEARGKITMAPETLNLILQNKLPKGNVIVTAKLAGIQAAKKTADIVPLCHPLRITAVDMEIVPDKKQAALLVTARVSARDRTGVEMEALAAVAIACLTIYDMAKAYDRRMVIGPIHLLSKTGGKSGSFRW